MKMATLCIFSDKIRTFEGLERPNHVMQTSLLLLYFWCKRVDTMLHWWLDCWSLSNIRVVCNLPIKCHLGEQ